MRLASEETWDPLAPPATAPLAASAFDGDEDAGAEAGVVAADDAPAAEDDDVSGAFACALLEAGALAAALGPYMPLSSDDEELDESALVSLDCAPEAAGDDAPEAADEEPLAVPDCVPPVLDDPLDALPVEDCCDEPDVDPPAALVGVTTSGAILELVGAVYIDRFHHQRTS